MFPSNWMILAMAYFCSESIYLQFIVHCMLLGGGCVCVAKGCERGSNVSPSVCLGLEFSFLQVHKCLKFAVFDCTDERPVFQIAVNLPWDLETLYKVPYKVY